jgi:hypothetical protein
MLLPILVPPVRVVVVTSGTHDPVMSKNSIPLKAEGL